MGKHSIQGEGATTKLRRLPTSLSASCTRATIFLGKRLPQNPQPKFRAKDGRLAARDTSTDNMKVLLSLCVQNVLGYHGTIGDAEPRVQLSI